MYTNWKVNDIVSIGVKVEDFCGTTDQFLTLGSSDMQLYPTPLNITCNRPNCSYYCIDTRNREVVFYSCMNYHVYGSDVNCANRSVDKYYREIGRVRGNGNGISSFNHQASETDLADYNDAISLGGVYNIVACINDSLAKHDHAVNFGSISISPYIPVTPTHYISLNMGFVPAGVMDYFDTYISEISNRIMSYLSPLPSPWQYVSTTYDRVSNSFKLWVYSPNALGYEYSPNVLGYGYEYGYTLGIVEDLQALWNWLTFYVPFIIGAILLILGIFILPAGWLAIVAIVGGLAIVVWKLTEIRTDIVKAEEKAKNADIQNQQTDKENKENQVNEDKWNKSSKGFDDCVARLEGRKIIHDGIIDGYMSQYIKYGGFVTEMKTEKEVFLNAANGIINDFKTKPYSVDVCNSSFISITNTVNDSNIRISGLINKYIKPDDPYITPPGGFSSKEECEKAGYHWYDNKCHEKGACWIPGPLDTCILSAETGKTLLLAGGLLAGGYIVYKVAVKKE